ncbi:androgen-dependent TFPI-regulating protein isoform X1 [Spodoptera frugiperda]|uniref:Androgen-dependent TFPI-regulating protein isoform X1 n=1 Tax=Spodoptera frugiperda TaxID=7108 RepID=A0A9R0DIX6_SPOFR|nr:androgen-dependent TFPI-regulating protein isoform X1 [Spodoptera frugiperda]
MEELIWKNSNIFYNVLCFLITENEKLFDRSDAKLYWTTVYHLFGVFHNVYITIFAAGLDIRSSPIIDIDNLYRFKAGYLTGWNFLFQTIFLTMSLVYDLMEWLDRHDSSLGRKLRFARDVMFSGLVVPLTLFISSMFWTLFWIDRELVFPQVYDQLVPWWFNHCVHTNIAIVVLIETLLQARRHPTHYKLELWLTGGAGVLYAIVYYSIYFSTHRWLYGVFGIMTWWQVCLYQLLIWSSTFLFYYIQFPINRIFHREDTSTEKSVTHEPKTGTPNNGYEEPSSGVPESWLKQRPKSQIENSSF